MGRLELEPVDSNAEVEVCNGIRRILGMELIPLPPESEAGNEAAAPLNPAQRKISARKMAANRANAGRSTGPKTPGGKARSKYNAVRHGVWAECALLPGDDRRELAKLAEEYQNEFAGGGTVERALATRMLAIAWKLRRLARAEETMSFDARHEAERDYAIVDKRTAVADKDGLAANAPPAGAPAPGDAGDEPIDVYDNRPSEKDDGGAHILVAAQTGPTGAQTLADDFEPGERPGRMRQLLEAEIRLTGQLASLSRLLLRAREKGIGGEGRRQSRRKASMEVPEDEEIDLPGMFGGEKTPR